jgi:hypothetical protein
MLSRFNLFNAMSLRTKVGLNFVPRTFIKSKSYNSHLIGYSMIELVNDIKLNPETQKPLESDEAVYNTRSLNAFYKLLTPNTYYIYLHRTNVIKDPVNPSRLTFKDTGHIAGFLTNESSEIREKSVMSLRNDQRITDKDGKYLKLTGEIMGVPQDHYVYSIDFVKSMEVELIEHFFKYSTTYAPRYLIGIPTHNAEQVKEIIDSVQNTKEECKGQYYKLFDGKINGIDHRAKNCVDGFLGGNNVTAGAFINPKPQLITWGFLTFALGPKMRDNLLAGTNLVEDCKDELEMLKVDNVLPTSRKFE